MKRPLLAIVGLVFVTFLLVKASYAQCPQSSMYIESGDHCEETWPDYIDVKIMMDMGSGQNGEISIWRCFIDYWDTYWIPVSATLGADMPAGSALVTNFNVDPQQLPPSYGTDTFVLLGMTPVNNPIPAGTNKHVATVRMNRTGYPVLYGCTALKFNGHANTTDWTDSYGNCLWGYGWPNTTLLNGKWNLRNNACDYVSPCPTGNYTPCGHCPYELEEKPTGPDTPVRHTPWSTIKELYR